MNWLRERGVTDKKRQQTTIVFEILSTLVLFSTPRFCDLKRGESAVFTDYLERGPATVLDLEAHGRSSVDIDKALSGVYQGNGLQPLWIKIR